MSTSFPPVRLVYLSVCGSIAPAMLRQASYGTIKIGTYQSFKRLLVDRPEGECILNPGLTDTLRERLVLVGQ